SSRRSGSKSAWFWTNRCSLGLDTRGHHHDLAGSGHRAYFVCFLTVQAPELSNLLTGVATEVANTVDNLLGNMDRRIEALRSTQAALQLPQSLNGSSELLQLPQSLNGSSELCPRPSAGQRYRPRQGAYDAGLQSEKAW